MALLHPPPPEQPKLKVRWRSGMTPNFEHQQAGVRTFVGVELNADQKFESHDREEVVPWGREYLSAIADGHLWALDEATARAAAGFAGRPKEFRSFMPPPADDAAPEVVSAPAPSPEPSKKVQAALDAAAKADPKR